MKKNSTDRKKLIKECDRLFSLYIRKRDKFCQAPNCNKPAQHCAHIFSRKNHSVRWYPDNAISLCYRHHIHWAHKEVMEFAEFIQKRLGKRRYDLLKAKKNNLSKVDMQLTLLWLEQELNLNHEACSLYDAEKRNNLCLVVGDK